MDLKSYIAPVIKYWWLLLLAAILAAASSFFFTSRQPPIYQTKTTLVIGRAVYQANPTSNDLYLNQLLSTYYVDLAQRQPIRDATMHALGLEWLPQYFAWALPNTSLIEIAVTDTSPVRAQAVANEIANQLILQSPTSSQNQEQDHKAFVEDQLSKLEKRIRETEDRVAGLEEDLAQMNSARQIAEAKEEINSLHTLLNTLQSNYSNLIANTGEGAVNTLTVIEPAGLPERPIGPNVKMIVLLSVVIALAITAGAAYLLEYLDDTIKTSEDVDRLLKLPVLGYLVEFQTEENNGDYLTRNPRSIAADAFRALRTNLEFVSVDHPPKTILVSSPSISDGKTSVATNLAVVMAQGGKKVILLDADLHRPNVHRRLGLQNSQGLTDLFRDQLSVAEVSNDWKVGNLKVITTGVLPPNPTDLLGSKKMDTILEAISKDADVVIIDGPPFLITDASVLSTKVDALLFVVRYGFTRRGIALRAREQIQRSAANVVGVALNRLPRGTDGYYYRRYGYFDESSAGTGDEDKNRLIPALPKRKTVFSRFFNRM